ncbi:MAG: hypothetical protein JXA94_07560 [Parachlamydiales bacterium]|nr:hypothetical protein [Parachlamydiales bacterium]
MSLQGLTIFSQGCSFFSGIAANIPSSQKIINVTTTVAMNALKEINDSHKVPLILVGSAVLIGGVGLWYVYNKKFNRIEKIPSAPYEPLPLKPYHEQVQQIRKERIEDDPDAEIARIETKGVLSEEDNKHLEDYTRNFSAETFLKRHFPASRVILARILELRKLYQNDYYCFTHGQSPSRIIISTLIKQLWKERYRKEGKEIRDLSCFKPFRVESYLQSEKHNEAYKNLTIEIARGSSNFGNSSITYNDNVFRSFVLSVDPYFWNTNKAESAVSFIHNPSILDREMGGFEKTVKRILDKTDISASKRKKTLIELLKLEEEFQKSSIPGNMFLICIPKRLMRLQPYLFGYMSHPMGRLCPYKNPMEILDSLQEGNIPLTCKKDGVIPQYRLFTTSLRPEAGVLSFCVTAAPKQLRKKIKRVIQECLLT